MKIFRAVFKQKAHGFVENDLQEVNYFRRRIPDPVKQKERFAKVVSGFQLFTNLSKISILDV